MANKTSEQQQQEAGAKPFFVHLLSSQRDPAAGPSGGPAPTYHCLDSECTKKYPSDDDESTSWFNDKDG